MSRQSAWTPAEPWTIRVGKRVRLSMLAFGPKNHRFVVGKVMRLLKQGWGVEVKLPSGQIVTRDTQDVAVAVSKKAVGNSRHRAIMRASAAVSRITRRRGRS